MAQRSAVFDAGQQARLTAPGQEIGVAAQAPLRVAARPASSGVHEVQTQPASGELERGATGLVGHVPILTPIKAFGG
jgi:hypothetical protein